VLEPRVSKTVPFVGKTYPKNWAALSPFNVAPLEEPRSHVVYSMTQSEGVAPPGVVIDGTRISNVS
jgi:hypothetical protein